MAKPPGGDLAYGDPVKVLGSDLENDRTLVVAERVDLARDVAALRLRDPDGGTLPSWQPGSHIDLVVPGDHGPLVRQFSLCGDPGDRTSFRVAVLREEAGRGGSVAVHERLYPGAPVVSRGPRNHFAFEVAPAYRFIAGGIGITAIYPMVRAAAAAGADWTLAYGGKGTEGMAFAAELRDAHPDRVRIYESRAGGRMDVAAQLAAPDAVTDIYCCGPESLMRAAELAASQLGWPAGALHVERFVARELGDVLWPEPFEVDLLLSGLTLTVQPGETILDKVRDSGGVVLSSCREGTCGTCETPVLEGLVDHRDSVLTADEQAAGDRMMICVSRAACERIVLEL
jgi:ferredoxin-NADP reductase